MEKEIQISFIIVNYQSRAYLERCVISIKNNLAGISLEIIVVNNDDLDLTFLAEIFPVRIIAAGKNIGFGTANNLGVREAKGEYLCFLNPDTEFISGSLQIIIDEFEKKNKVGVIGPKLLSESNKIQWWSTGKEPNITDLLLNNLGYYQSRKIWESKEKIETDWVSGAAFCMRKDLFQKLGGFDKKFFMYYEDIDLCKRARNLGYKIIYMPGIIIKHFGGKSFTDKKIQKKYFYASQDCYFQKHFGKSRSTVVKILRKIFQHV